MKCSMSPWDSSWCHLLLTKLFTRKGYSFLTSFQRIWKFHYPTLHNENSGHYVCFKNNFPLIQYDYKLDIRMIQGNRLCALSEVILIIPEIICSKKKLSEKMTESLSKGSHQFFLCLKWTLEQIPHELAQEGSLWIYMERGDLLFFTWSCFGTIFPAIHLGFLKELPPERSQPKAGAQFWGSTVGPERNLLVVGFWGRPRFRGRSQVSKVEKSHLGFFNSLISVQENWCLSAEYQACIHCINGWPSVLLYLYGEDIYTAIKSSYTMGST